MPPGVQGGRGFSDRHKEAIVCLKESEVKVANAGQGRGPSRSPRSSATLYSIRTVNFDAPGVIMTGVAVIFKLQQSPVRDAGRRKLHQGSFSS